MLSVKSEIEIMPKSKKKHFKKKRKISILLNFLIKWLASQK